MYNYSINHVQSLFTMTTAEVAPYGDLPSWFSAIGTVGAFAIALYLLWTQIKDRRRYLLNEIESSCRSVSAWYDLASKELIIWVQNLGKEPVFDLVVYIGNADVDFNAPCEKDNFYTEIVFGIIPPGGKLDCRVEKSAVSGALFPDLPSIELEFTDTNQLHWRRLSNGKLQQVQFRRPFD